MTNRPSVLLIFGTSHVGKSTLADQIGGSVGWPVRSTDQMAQHPGRPWPHVKPPVSEFYANLSDKAVYWFLQAHHENMWPGIQREIIAATQSKDGVIFEGSALRPEFIASLDTPNALAIGLYAGSDFLRSRIENESNYAQQDDRTRKLIDAFVRRSLTDNAMIVSTAKQHGLQLVDVSDQVGLKRTTDLLLDKLGS